MFSCHQSAFWPIDLGYVSFLGTLVAEFSILLAGRRSHSLPVLVRMVTFRICSPRSEVPLFKISK